ncbi:uncharacterized protein si:dkey-39a18.1 [Brienomyrus brachyistius]|uniref:uncharacterized protein si:dkey-39a18.1 n=1 Tax=Brienomyrus brachyistius TaxID=42636 RepID=UPI0020B28770|nr:uncharacterized protein si:dkey-39a18.1 [Brienomyrus brachyistius]
MKLVGHRHQPKAQNVLDQQTRKQRVHSAQRDISPVPSSYSEPVSLRQRKGVTGELLWLRGCGIWEDEDETQSVKSLQCGRRVRRPRAFAKTTDLKLPPVSIDGSKIRCSLMVQGSSYPRGCAFPPICQPRTARAWGLERPPSRAGKRGMERLCEVEDCSKDADPSHMTTENFHIHPPTSTCVPAKDQGRMEDGTPAMGEVFFGLGISIPRGPGGGRDLLLRKPQGWKQLWQVMVPQKEGMRLPPRPQQHGGGEPQDSSWTPNSGHGPYIWRPPCRCNSPAPPHLLQLPGLSFPSMPARCLATRTVELASSNGGLVPKITMTCPTPKILP